jgi:hypothetical protein
VLTAPRGCPTTGDRRACAIALFAVSVIVFASTTDAGEGWIAVTKLPEPQGTMVNLAYVAGFFDAVALFELTSPKIEGVSAALDGEECGLRIQLAHSNQKELDHPNTPLALGRSTLS